MPKFDPAKHGALVLVLEGLTMLLMRQGLPKDEAIEGAGLLFATAHNEATCYELECALAASADDAE